jgi:hypothetical protein
VPVRELAPELSAPSFDNITSPPSSSNAVPNSLNSPSASIRLLSSPLSGGALTNNNSDVKTANRRGSLLGPFKFMTSDIDENKIQYYSKRDLLTLSKQLEMLEYLLVGKFQEERTEAEGEILKAWMLVKDKEEEAFNMTIKERTIEEVQNVHTRLIEMVCCSFSI